MGRFVPEMTYYVSSGTLNLTKLKLKLPAFFAGYIYLYNQNLLPVQKKIHFTHLRQYDENHCVYVARIGRHSEKKQKAGGNVTRHVQHRMI